MFLCFSKGSEDEVQGMCIKDLSVSWSCHLCAADSDFRKVLCGREWTGRTTFWLNGCGSLYDNVFFLAKLSNMFPSSV